MRYRTIISRFTKTHESQFREAKTSLIITIRHKRVNIPVVYLTWRKFRSGSLLERGPLKDSFESLDPG